MKSKTIINISLTLTLLLILSTGITYAVWMLSAEQNELNIAGTGCFAIDFTSNSDAITLTNTYPLSDLEGLNTTPHTFTITNTCDYPLNYQVNLEVLNTTTLNHNLIKTTLDYDLSKTLNNFTNTTSVLENSSAYTLKTGTLIENEQKTYDLRLWVDYAATLENSQNKEIHAKIAIIATPNDEIEPFTLVDNLSLISDGMLLHDNPNRGFRSEAYITIGSDQSWPDELQSYPPPLKSNDPHELLNLNRQIDYDGIVENYYETELNVVQAYVYLYNFIDQPLTENDLNQLTEYLEEAKRLDIKLTLRFAYKREVEMTKEPTAEQIVRNNKVIEQWIDNNITLFKETVYSTQFGLIGLWGEVHSSIEIPYPPDEEAIEDTRMIAQSALEMFPEEYTIMLRDYEYLYENIKDLSDRFTFHDDWYNGISYTTGTGMVPGMQLPYNSREFELLTNISSTTISDGEMPWGWDQTIPSGSIDMEDFVMLMANYGFTTFSLMHNNTELYPNHEHLVFERAKTEYLTESFFINNNIPYNPAMLENGQITALDYMNFHLGYQLGLTNYENNNGEISFVLNNFGFGTISNMNITIKDGDKVLHEGQLEDLYIEQYGYHKFTFDNITSSELTIDVYNRIDNSKIKLANNLEVRNNLTILPIA